MKKFDWAKLVYTIISSSIYSLGVVMFLNPANTYSVASGLDYPGIGPKHCYLNDTGRVN